MPAQPVASRPPSGERAERKRRDIVATAREVFLREGFGAGMDLIAREAGVSKVTVYNHFHCKDTLFTAVVGHALEEALDAANRLAVADRLGTSDDIRADLVATCRALVAGLANPRVLALRNLVAGEVRRFPQLGKAWQEHGPDRFHATLGAALRRLAERGLLDIPDIDLAVLQLSGLVLSPHLVYSSYDNAPDAALTDRLITGGVDVFLSHYGR
ncbi:TetR/AcrR family transcriptional regulator [Streptomyces sp. NPDC048506]|uniref:TetR/AcrR family transcriptional regulator n=1 Tax=Streptomyces sp. NPDC048506 TaxID=3155028 RepID=UPI003419A2F6